MSERPHGGISTSSTIEATNPTGGSSHSVTTVASVTAAITARGVRVLGVPDSTLIA